MNAQPRIEDGISKLLSRRVSEFIRVTAFLIVAVLISSVAAEARAHRLNTDELKLFELISKTSLQKREKAALDPILCKVARERAADMARKGYFAHVNPQGLGANYLVRRAGFLLPSYYEGSKSGNNIESLAMTTGDARQAYGLWIHSGGHRGHVLGELEFYKQQTSMGVGVFRSPQAPYYKYFVLISAPENLSPRPPLRILKSPKGKVIARTKRKVAL